MTSDFVESLVDAATEMIVQNWSPEAEYDDAGRAATVAVLRALGEAGLSPDTGNSGLRKIRDAIKWAQALDAQIGVQGAPHD